MSILNDLESSGEASSYPFTYCYGEEEATSLGWTLLTMSA